MKNMIDTDYVSILVRLQRLITKFREYSDTSFDESIRSVRLKYQVERSAAETRFDDRKNELGKVYQDVVDKARLELVQKLDMLDTTKKRQLSGIETTVERVIEQLGPAAISWKSKYWLDQNLELPSSRPNAVRIGTIKTSSNVAGLSHVIFPAFVEVATHKHITFQTKGNASIEVVGAIQSLLLRMVASFEPNALRIRLVDPARLGANFSLFDPTRRSLFGKSEFSRIEAIKTVVAELEEHVRTVTHMYKGSRYPDLESYNASVTGQYLPYYYLVVVDFPMGFDAATTTRLKSLMSNGPAAGVFLILHVNNNEEIPKNWNLDIKEIEAQSTTLRQISQYEFQSDVPKLKQYPILLDYAPPTSVIKRILDENDVAARNVAEFILDFDSIRIPAQDRWKGNSTYGLQVPIGRDSNNNMTYFELGNQKKAMFHGSIGGTTGSGKGNLLRVLITQLMLKYSYDELELYLVDFRQGADFAIYRNYHLPHIRAVALSSSREFVLSILEKLKSEVEERSRLFYEEAGGATRLEEYRLRTGKKLPRILVVIDELRELFNVRESTASKAAMHLLGFALQGRGYGIHLLFSSQSIQSLPPELKEVLRQMHLRICFRVQSAEESEQFLGTGNYAASKLPPYGYAIINTPGDPEVTVRVAHLAESNQPSILHSLSQDLANLPSLVPLPKTRVFARDSVASFASNEAFNRILSLKVTNLDPSDTRVWIGQSISIKEDTSAELAFRNDGNLIVVGNDESLAYGSLAAAIFSALAWQQLSDCRIYVLAPARRGMALDPFFSSIANSLPESVLAHKTYDLADTLSQIAETVNLRKHGTQSVNPIVYLVLAGLGRFNELYEPIPQSKYDSGLPNVWGKLLQGICRDGPTQGVHTFVWVETLDDLHSVFGRELGIWGARVVLQGVAEQASVALLGTNAAEELALANLAYFRDPSWPRKEMELFQPYKKMSSAEIEQIAHQILASRKP